ncbi:putative btb poz domain protein [Lasiodiplodia theobromae]|nr:putative btb poz domain protein [Lasiodiplodia theobromae]
MAGLPGNDAIYKAVESGDYCDLRLRLSDDTELKVHRVVLCTQCEFFANAMKPGRFLANSSVIDMKHDPPQAIKRLVEFLYTGHYTVKGPENPDTDEPTPHAAGLESPPDEDAEPLLAHADVYIISKLYEVAKLEEEAFNAIKSALEEPKTLEVFPRLVQTIYASVSEAACSVHDELSYYALSHASELISGNHLSGMIQTAPDLTEKLIRHLVSSNSTKTEQLLAADVDIKRLEDKAKEASAEIEKLQNKGKEADPEIEKLQDKVKEADAETKKLQDKVKEADAETKKLKIRVEGKNDELQLLYDRVNRGDTQIRRLKDDLNDVQCYRCSRCCQHFEMVMPAGYRYITCPLCGHERKAGSWRRCE